MQCLIQSETACLPCLKPHAMTMLSVGKPRGPPTEIVKRVHGRLQFVVRLLQGVDAARIDGHTRCGGVVHRKPEEVAKSNVDASPKTDFSIGLGKGAMGH